MKRGDALRKITVRPQQTTTTHTIRLSGASHANIVGDRDRLSQVFTNLLTNAIKYSPQATAVDVQIVPSAEMVTVSVRDYGVGIAPAHQGKIFERFYRVQDSHDKTFPGLGMGLYISQQIVERHGGKLWVTSEEGEGATFSVTLPSGGSNISETYLRKQAMDGKPAHTEAREDRGIGPTSRLDRARKYRVSLILKRFS